MLTACVPLLGGYMAKVFDGEWTLFTPEESALPEGERRRIAVAKMKREGDFFKAQYAKAGLKAG